MENILEDNKLIAEFMVQNEGGLVKLKENIFSTIDNFEIPDDYLTLKDLKYHEDWNWLMLVVDKIESIKGTQIFINGISCEIMFKGKVITKHFNTKIEAVYNACVEFIKWYNKQNKNNESL